MSKFKDPRMKGFQKFHYVDEALRVFLNTINTGPLRSEIVPILKSYGRVLAEDIISPVNIPAFHKAAMDGYAVKSEDTEGASSEYPVRLKVVGESSPGRPYEGIINSGEAVKIATGARLPDGADCVVKVESTRRVGNFVEVFESVPMWQNVAKIGEDIKQGEVILRAGTVLESFDVALLMSMGFKFVKVTRKPIVGILATGSELVDIGEYDPELHSGEFIVETNRGMLRQLIIEFGGEIRDFGIVEDDYGKIKAKLQDALNSSDIVVVTGGSSVGEYDLIPLVINELGEPGVVVHGVTAHPGRPVALASVNGKPILNIPGYPVAAYVDFILFFPPVLFKLLGIKGEYIPRTIKARLAGKIPSRPGTRTFARVKLFTRDGLFYAKPIRITGAGVLSSLSRGDGFVVVPEDLEGFDEGEEVDVLLFRRFVNVKEESV